MKARIHHRKGRQAPRNAGHRRGRAGGGAAPQRQSDCAQPYRSAKIELGFQQPERLMGASPAAAAPALRNAGFNAIALPVGFAGPVEESALASRPPPNDGHLVVCLFGGPESRLH